MPFLLAYLTVTKQTIVQQVEEENSSVELKQQAAH
jgi:hypothetical protein